MKRIIALLLVLVLAFSMISCGDKDDDAKTTVNEASITVQAETGWLPYYEAAIAKVLEEYPNAKIEINEVSSFDHLDTLSGTDVLNEDIADVFAIPADRLSGLAANESLAGIPADKMAKNVGGFENFDAELGGNFKVGDEYLAFPMNIETLIVFANKANAAEIGLDLTQTIEFTDLGYEDMLTAAFNAWFGVALTNSADIELLGFNDDDELYSDLTKDFSELSADKQALFTALYDFWKKHDDMTTDAWDSSAAWGYMDDAFTTGGTNALRIDGPWTTGGQSERAGNGADLEILPITQVTINGNPLAHWKGGWGLAVNARVEGQDDQMELAQAMIEELMNPANALEMFEASGKIMPNVKANVYADSEMSDVDKKVVAAVLESYAIAPNRPLFQQWDSVWSTWENALLSWSAVKPANAEDAYKEIQASFTAMMLNFE